jgi:ring-1,2-phenylacetyl-CoA epoxidase subunit PaaC
MPSSTNSASLVPYLLHLADNALILGQRNAEWCAHGPSPEQDIAITNITLDLIGQARNLYQYAAQLINESNTTTTATEDSLAYLRDAKEFKNYLLVEQPKGDWAVTILRQFFFSQYQSLLYRQLENNKDEQVAAIATKSLKEIAYHLRWSSEWVIRLGDGTEESHQRMRKAIDQLWMYTGELLETGELETAAGISITGLKDEWTNKVKEIFEEATLSLPGKTTMQKGGQQGKHSAHLAELLTDLQSMQRAYPGLEW